ncbi:hypothetical protein MNB_SV-14-899 [hydrothermal vent metagenome]|uniref:Lipoprotein n=1 Tax=hydrothermal vent metagenome TaxID=652676 RepID=A0A1W1BYR4_9ZZZZ
MKYLIINILFLFMIGCSNQNVHLQDKEIKYQRFLSEKNLKSLESSYEK